MTNSPEPRGSRDETILILAPRAARRADLAAPSDAGLDAEVCGSSVAELCRREKETQASASSSPARRWRPAPVACIVEALAAQAPWSDIPVVVLTSGGGRAPTNADALDALGEAGNVTLIERPVRVTTLSTCRSRARAPPPVRRARPPRPRGARERGSGAERGAAAHRARSGPPRRVAARPRDPPPPPTAPPSARPTRPRPRRRPHLRSARRSHRPRRPRTHARSVEYALRERTVCREECRVRWPDGSPHWVLVVGRGETMRREAPLRETGVTLDITARKEAEQERERLLAGEHAARVEGSRRRAASRTNFWRPSCTSCARRDRRARLDAHPARRAFQREGRRARARNRRAQRALAAAAHRRLLDVSRIITGKLRLDVRPVAPAAFIRAAVEAVLPAAEAKEISLKLETDTGVGSVAGDRRAYSRWCGTFSRTPSSSRRKRRAGA